MYLGEKLVDQNENEYDMVGILKGISKMTKSLRRFGYCYGIAKEDTILSNVGEVIKGMNSTILYLRVKKNVLI